MSKVHVDYKFRDGLHCFTSKQMPGLVVAHGDFARALADVPRVIEKLIAVNEDMEVDAGLVRASFEVCRR